MIRIRQPASRTFPRKGVNVSSKVGRFRLSSWLVACVVALLLASCSNDSSTPDDRRFANDPADEETQATQTPTGTAVPTVAQDTTPIASPASILKTRGSPETIYQLDEDGITSVTVADGTTTETTWAPGDGQRFAAIDDAPDGSRVAALVLPANNSEGGANLVVFDSVGAVSLSITGILNLSSMFATPISDGTGGAMTQRPEVFVSWSPLNDQILVGSSDGQLRSVPTDGGEPIAYEPDVSLSGLEVAKWSPDGSVIGALVRDEAGLGRVLALSVDGASLASEVLIDSEDTENANSIEQFAWSADGSSILYVTASRENRDPVGGQLFNLDLDSGSSTLVATAGRGGPSAAIASFAPSPDGRLVAYVIAVRDGDRWIFHSLIVKSLRDGSSYDVPVGGINDIPDTWWVSEGLVWDRATSQDAAFVLVRPDGNEQELVPTATEGTAVTAATPEPAG